MSEYWYSLMVIVRRPQSYADYTKLREDEVEVLSTNASGFGDTFGTEANWLG
jgi:hypothetical protein